MAFLQVILFVISYLSSHETSNEVDEQLMNSYLLFNDLSTQTYDSFHWIKIVESIKSYE